MLDHGGLCWAGVIAAADVAPIGILDELEMRAIALLLGFDNISFIPGREGSGMVLLEPCDDRLPICRNDEDAVTADEMVVDCVTTDGGTTRTQSMQLRGLSYIKGLIALLAGSIASQLKKYIPVLEILYRVGMTVDKALIQPGSRLEMFEEAGMYSISKAAVMRVKRPLYRGHWGPNATCCADFSVSPVDKIHTRETGRDQ